MRVAAEDGKAGGWVLLSDTSEHLPHAFRGEEWLVIIAGEHTVVLGGFTIRRDMGGNQDVRILRKGGSNSLFELSSGIIGESSHDFKPKAADLGVKSRDGLVRAAKISDKKKIVEQDGGVFIVPIAAIGPAIVAN